MVDAFFPNAQREIPLRCRLWILQFVSEADFKALRVTSSVWDQFGGNYSAEEWGVLREGERTVTDITAPLISLKRSANIDCEKLTTRGLNVLGDRISDKAVAVTLRNLKASVPIQVVCQFLARLPGTIETLAIDGYLLLTGENAGLLGQHISQAVKRIYFSNCPADGVLAVSPGPGATDERVIALADGFEKPVRRQVDVIDLRNCFGLTDKCAEALCGAVSQAKTVRLGGCTGFSKNGMRKIFDDLSPSVELIDVSGCPGFTDAIALGVAMQLGQTLCRLDVRHCENLTDKGLVALVKAVPMKCTELAVGSAALGDEQLAAILGALEQTKMIKITIAGLVGKQVSEVLNTIGFQKSQTRAGETVYEHAQRKLRNPQLKDPKPPRSVSNSPLKKTIGRAFELMPTVVLLEDENELAQLAETGDLKAQLALARLYWTRSQKEKKRDISNQQQAIAIKWCQQPAKAGILDAQFLLACCLQYGKERSEEWITWLRKAADGKHTEAQYKLADAYQCGEKGLLPKSAALRFKYLLLAAKQDHVKAQCEVSMCYGSGWGTEKSETMALYWKRRAAGNGDASSQCSLGFSYLHGISGVKRDPQEAVKWFDDANNQDHDPATVKLSRCYIHGWGTWRAPKKAVRLLEGVINRPLEPRRTRDRAWYEAKLEFAVCLAEGIGIDEDHEKSKELLEGLIYPPAGYSANHNREVSYEAQYYLGTCYETGRLGEQDYDKAFALYDKAKKGNGFFYLSHTGYKAKFRLGRCHLKGWGTPVNQKVAYSFFNTAYLHVLKAAYYAGLCLEKGWGVERSKFRAKSRYEWVISESLNHGKPGPVKEAQERLKRLEECVIM